jgi:hypothetical protein
MRFVRKPTLSLVLLRSVCVASWSRPWTAATRLSALPTARPSPRPLVSLERGWPWVHESDRFEALTRDLVRRSLFAA